MVLDYSVLNVLQTILRKSWQLIQHDTGTLTKDAMLRRDVVIEAQVCMAERPASHASLLHSQLATAS